MHTKIKAFVMENTNLHAVINFRPKKFKFNNIAGKVNRQLVQHVDVLVMCSTTNNAFVIFAILAAQYRHFCISCFSTVFTKYRRSIQQSRCLRDAVTSDVAHSVPALLSPHTPAVTSPLLMCLLRQNQQSRKHF